ncbi:MAG: hypothetical protein ACI90V_008216 [Bacillariaceae sp.]|jgi:hypothetical protein
MMDQNLDMEYTGIVGRSIVNFCMNKMLAKIIFPKFLLSNVSYQ